MPQPPLSERYDVLETLFEDATHRILAAADRSTGARVHVVRFDPSIQPEASVLDRIREVNERLKELRSSAVGVFVEDGSDDQGIYFVFPVAEGALLLDKTIRKTGDDAVWLGLAYQLMQAVKLAHGVGIYHGGLCSRFVACEAMPEGPPRLRVFGFGLAMLFPAFDARRKDAPFFGDVNYLAPELLKGEAFDPASDVYSLGVLLYEAIARKQPFSSHNVETIVRRQIHEKPLPMHLIKPRFPNVKTLGSFIERLLQKTVAGRFANVSELIEQIQALRGDLQPDLALEALITEEDVVQARVVVAPAPEPEAPAGEAAALDLSGVPADDEGKKTLIFTGVRVESPEAAPQASPKPVETPAAPVGEPSEAAGEAPEPEVKSRAGETVAMMEAVVATPAEPEEAPAAEPEPAPTPEPSPETDTGEVAAILPDTSSSRSSKKGKKGKKKGKKAPAPAQAAEPKKEAALASTDAKEAAPGGFEGETEVSSWFSTSSEMLSEQEAEFHLKESHVKGTKIFYAVLVALILIVLVIVVVASGGKDKAEDERAPSYSAVLGTPPKPVASKPAAAVKKPVVKKVAEAPAKPALVPSEADAAAKAQAEKDAEQARLEAEKKQRFFALKQKGQAHYAGGRYADALAAFSEAHAIDAGDSDVLRMKSASEMELAKEKAQSDREKKQLAALAAKPAPKKKAKKKAKKPAPKPVAKPAPAPAPKPVAKPAPAPVKKVAKAAGGEDLAKAKSLLQQGISAYKAKDYAGALKKLSKAKTYDPNGKVKIVDRYIKLTKKKLSSK